MYKVVEFFHDLKDGDHPYEIGDVYPRKGSNPTQERIDELAGTGNVRGYPLIEVVTKSEDSPKVQVKKAPKRA